MNNLNKISAKGFTFSKHIPKEISHFDRVFDIFKELLTHTSGDIEEAFEWLNELDEEYDIFSDEYTLEDFENDLKKRGYIKEEIDEKNGTTGTGKGKNVLTAKLESALREYALDQIFGKLKKSGIGNHQTTKVGVGDERDGENRSFQYGDDLSTVNMTESLKNAQINNGIGDLRLTENDLIVEESKHKAQMSTVLMIDISHSMILYGEDDGLAGLRAVVQQLGNTLHFGGFFAGKCLPHVHEVPTAHSVLVSLHVAGLGFHPLFDFRQWRQLV